MKKLDPDLENLEPEHFELKPGLMVKIFSMYCDLILLYNNCVTV